uniref:Uncharacterized protein n=1 Tax=Triticum urartu TaxID=4572 RepID=A0A8R7QVI2_TRIUA
RSRRRPSTPSPRRSAAAPPPQPPWVRCTDRWPEPGRCGARRPRWRSRTRRSSRAAAPTSASSTTAASSPPSSASARSAAPTRPRSRSRWSRASPPFFCFPSVAVIRSGMHAKK